MTSKSIHQLLLNWPSFNFECIQLPLMAGCSDQEALAAYKEMAKGMLKAAPSADSCVTGNLEATLASSEVAKALNAAVCQGVLKFLKHALWV